MVVALAAAVRVVLGVGAAVGWAAAQAVTGPEAQLGRVEREAARVAGRAVAVGQAGGRAVVVGSRLPHCSRLHYPRPAALYVKMRGSHNHTRSIWQRHGR
jgi:hypothetical protein